jgi:transposase
MTGGNERVSEESGELTYSGGRDWLYIISLSAEENRKLKEMSRKYTSPYRVVIRAKIVLYAAAGLGNDEIASRLDTPRQIVSKWRKRFAQERFTGLEEQPRRGRPARFSPLHDHRS